MLTRVRDDPGPLRVERLLDGRRKLLRPLKVDVGPTANGQDIQTVPEGFSMDYSSLPWGLRWLVKWDRVDIAGVVHDHLYRTAGSFTWRSRWEADLVWFRLARSGGHRANWLQAALGFAGLYLGACWVGSARPKCTWRHKAAMAIVDLLLLGLIAWALCEWQHWVWMVGELWQFLMTHCIGRLALVFSALIAVVVSVNLFQSRPRYSLGEKDRDPTARPTTTGDEEE